VKRAVRGPVETRFRVMGSDGFSNVCRRLDVHREEQLVVAVGVVEKEYACRCQAQADCLVLSVEGEVGVSDAC